MDTCKTAMRHGSWNEAIGAEIGATKVLHDTAPVKRFLTLLCPIFLKYFVSEMCVAVAAWQKASTTALFSLMTSSIR